MGYDSIRPDLKYIRSGGLEGRPMGCGGTCPMCRAYAEETARRREPRLRYLAEERAAAEQAGRNPGSE